jgi:hypothetical protein
MNQLETTLISLARTRLSDVLAFHTAQQAGTPTDEECHEFAGNFGALFAFLELCHFTSGLSAEASEALAAIEQEYTAALPPIPERAVPDMQSEVLDCS